jgi:hypothetical protein
MFRCSCKTLSFLFLLQVLTVFPFPVLSSTVIDGTDVEHQQNELLSWTNFSVNYRGRPILHLNRTGTVYSGRILAVLGPSG